MIKIEIQKRFADVDMLGHVNNVNMQHYFDLGKTYFFNSVLHIDDMLAGVSVITASTKTDYLAQTRLNDRSHVETYVEKVGNKSMTLYQRIVDSDTGVVNAESRSVMVAFDFSRQESAGIPEEWRAALGGHML